MAGGSIPETISEASLSLQSRFNSLTIMDDDTHEDGPQQKRRRLSSLLSHGSWSSRCEVPRRTEPDHESAKWDFDPELRKEVTDCTRCEITVTETMRLTDIDSGVYDPLRTPAYIPPHCVKEELVDPFDKGSESSCLNTSVTDLSQQQRLPLSHTLCPVQEFTLNEPGGVPDGTSAALRLYGFHKHVHEHCFSRRTFLVMCRDDEELKDYRFWVWQTLEEELTRRGFTHNQIQASREEVRNGEWPFKSETGRNQVRLWRGRSQARKDRLERQRRRWKKIKADLELRRRMNLWKEHGRTIGKGCRSGKIWSTIREGRSKLSQRS